MKKLKDFNIVYAHLKSCFQGVEFTKFWSIQEFIKFVCRTMLVVACNYLIEMFDRKKKKEYKYGCADYETRAIYIPSHTR